MDVAQAQFALDLVNELSSNATTSLIISPVSIFLALSLAYVGSCGDTRKEFQERFGVNDTTDSQLFNHLSEFVKNANSLNSLVKTWSHGYAPLKNNLNLAYQLKIQKLYGTFIEQLDFENREFAAKKVNLDVEIHTNGQIKKIVTNNMFTSDAFLLLNTLHLKARWFNKFDSSKNSTFYLSAISQRQTDMMHLETGHGSLGCQYAENPDFHLLRLPYMEKQLVPGFGEEKLADLYFNLLLPKERFGLANALGKLNGSVLLEMLESLEERDFVIDMPSFKSEFEMNLNNALPKLGLSDGFSNANFCEISPSPYFIKNVIHKANIDVNIHGTEAAAATVIQMTTDSMWYPYKLTKIQADHPFLYLITNNKNDVLFAGIYN